EATLACFGTMDVPHYPKLSSFQRLNVTPAQRQVFRGPEPAVETHEDRQLVLLAYQRLDEAFCLVSRKEIHLVFGNMRCVDPVTWIHCDQPPLDCAIESSVQAAMQVEYGLWAERPACTAVSLTKPLSFRLLNVERPQLCQFHMSQGRHDLVSNLLLVQLVRALLDLVLHEGQPPNQEGVDGARARVYERTRILRPSQLALQPRSLLLRTSNNLAVPAGVRLACCVTCLFSDYSPAGHGLLGMQCHRSAKEQYLAVRVEVRLLPGAGHGGRHGDTSMSALRAPCTRHRLSWVIRMCRPNTYQSGQFSW